MTQSPSIIHSLRQTALLLIGHGSTKNPDSIVSANFQAGLLGQSQLFAEVRAAFWKVEPKIDPVLDAIRQKNVLVMPFFLSEGYFTQEMLPQYFGFARETGGIYRKKNLLYCRPVGIHPKISEIIDARIRSVMTCEKAPTPAETCLFIAAHGTEQNARSAQFALAQAQRLSEKRIFAEVQAIFLDQAPFIRDWRNLTRCKQIAVIPYFLSDGLHVTDDLPELFGFHDRADLAEFSLMAVGSPRIGANGKIEMPDYVMKKSLFGAKKDLVVAAVDGHTIWYARSLGREPQLANVILELCHQRAGG